MSIGKFYCKLNVIFQMQLNLNKHHIRLKDEKSFNKEHVVFCYVSIKNKDYYPIHSSWSLKLHNHKYILSTRLTQGIQHQIIRLTYLVKWKCGQRINQLWSFGNSTAVYKRIIFKNRNKDTSVFQNLSVSCTQISIPLTNFQPNPSSTTNQSTAN